MEEKKYCGLPYEKKDLFEVLFDGKWPLQMFFESLSRSENNLERAVAEIGFSLMRDFSQYLLKVEDVIEKDLGSLELHIYENKKEEKMGIINPNHDPQILGVVLSKKEANKEAA